MTGEVGSTVQTLRLPRDRGVSSSGLEVRWPQCSVGHSNAYVVYLKRWQRELRSIPKYFDFLALFRLNFDDTSSCRLQYSLPEDLSDTSAEFHPSITLPILWILFDFRSESPYLGKGQLSCGK